MKDAVARLHTPRGTGTAWLCSREYALTAAHCVECTQDTSSSRVTGLGRPYPPVEIGLEFPSSKGVRVTVADVAGFDLGLDAASLRLPVGALPSTVEAIPAGAVPQRENPDALRWSAFGFPRAHEVGLTLTGCITDVGGRVGKYPALQLFCNQGGLGELNGASGSAVCIEDVAVGLIRYGTLAHRVVFAASLEHIGLVFPEVGQILRGAPPYVSWTKKIGFNSSPLAPAAKAMLRKKRDFFQERLAITGDPSQKFALIKGITEIDQQLHGNTDSLSARLLWEEKLRFYQAEAAITADAAQAFALKEQIEEAFRKIQELGE